MPTGLQYSLEVAAFAVFMVIVGRIGTAELAASGIAFNLNMIVFMPMVGLAVAVSSLVGRYLGARSARDVAERVVGSALAMSFAYMARAGCCTSSARRCCSRPTALGADPATWPRIAAIATVLLRFVAFYSIFDMMNLIHAAGLRGAGDTVYPMLAHVRAGLGRDARAGLGRAASCSGRASTSRGRWRAATCCCSAC